MVIFNNDFHQYILRSVIPFVAKLASCLPLFKVKHAVIIKISTLSSI